MMLPSGQMSKSSVKSQRNSQQDFSFYDAPVDLENFRYQDDDKGVFESLMKQIADGDFAKVMSSALDQSIIT